VKVCGILSWNYIANTLKTGELIPLPYKKKHISQNVLRLIGITIAHTTNRHGYSSRKYFGIYFSETKSPRTINNIAKRPNNIKVIFLFNIKKPLDNLVSLVIQRTQRIRKQHKTLIRK
jgi:hypothetical protein